MKARELLKIGFKEGPVVGKLVKACDAAKAQGIGAERIRRTVKHLYSEPQQYTRDPLFGEAAALWSEVREPQTRYAFKDKPFPIWGAEYIEPEAIEQMRNAMRLPIAVAGAAMPDAHLGYGIPIGGVIATQGAVVPSFVGVDIACRMMMSVLPVPLDDLDRHESAYVAAIEKNTSFGVGAVFDRPKDHPVMDRDWSMTPITARIKDKAWSQLGTSGSGNHFVDVGELTFVNGEKRLAILTHSGSRGAGSETADYYIRLAESLHPKLPPQYKRLAWLELGKEGDEYWAAMELMGEYASANHHLIHEGILRSLGVQPIMQVENHHNFAWRETHGGKEVIVHRKGATPAGQGVRGIIPGSMGTPGFLVQGKGNEESLLSASHGAGRAMSRRKTKESFRWNQVNSMLKQRGIRVLSAGLDEVPGGYKNILEVMDAQSDLVEIVARFDPKLVKMSGDGTSED